MEKITYIDRKKLISSLRKHEKLILKDPILKEELYLFEKRHKDEKLRRDIAYVREKDELRAGCREEK